MAIMNENISGGKWAQVKGKIREAWGELTEDDLEKTKGDISQITGLVQQKYGEAQEAIRSKLNSLVKNIGSDSNKNVKH